VKRASIALVLAAVIALVGFSTVGAVASPQAPIAHAVTAKKKSPARKSAERACRKQFRKQGRRLGRGAKKKHVRAFKLCVSKKLRKRAGTGSPGGTTGGTPGTTTPSPGPGGGGNDTLDPGEY
jgi:hypothetical protein